VSAAAGATLRVGIAGAGIGLRYARSFQAIPGVEVAALCAATPLRAAPAAAELGIGALYTSFAAMLAEVAPEIVVVATPNDLHRPQSLAAIAAGSHVLCDKPLGLDAHEANELLAAAEASGVRHAIPFWLRFVPAVERARALLGEGSLGAPVFADVRFLNCGWGDPEGPMRWQFERARAGSGALANIGSHAIDALHWLAGDVVRLAAVTSVAVPERRRADGTLARPDAEDTAAFVGELANGAPVSFLASSVAYAARSAITLAVHCRGGSVTVSIDSSDARSGGRLSVMRRGDDVPRDEPLEDAPAGGGLQDAAYGAIARELVGAIREGRPASPGFADGARAQAVIDAALGAAGTGGWRAVAYAPTQ
jgi:predicted dehydrogenase